MDQGKRSDAPSVEPFTATHDAIAIYGLAMDSVSSQADRIWSTFSYLFAVNSALLALYFFARKDLAADPHYEWLLAGIAAVGLFTSWWSFVTMRGNWLWHRHFVQRALAVESQFHPSSNWSRILFRKDAPVSKRQFSVLSHDRPGPMYGRTQPFLVALIVAWIGVGASSLAMLLT